MSRPAHDDPRWRESTSLRTVAHRVGDEPEMLTQVWDLDDGEQTWRATADGVNPRARTAHPPKGVPIKLVTP